MSTTKVANISNLEGTKTITTNDLIDRATCRAWVNFNGTGTVAIRASFNVSSITDNGIGDYTVNFTTAMPDVDYATLFMSPSAFIEYHSGIVNEIKAISGTRITVSSLSYNSSFYIDPSQLNISILR